MKHIQTQTEWENEMGLKVIEFIKSELYLDLPFLSIALSGLSPSPNDQLSSFGTDGTYSYYSSTKLISLFQKNPLFLNRSYLHMILHCLYYHLWQRNSRNQRLWNIACDICVEYTIDHIQKPSVQRVLSYLRIRTYDDIERLQGLSAVNVYVWLLEKDEKELALIEREFYTDDHRFWPKEEKGAASTPNQAEKNWQKIAKQTAMSKNSSKEDGDGNNVLISQIQSQKGQRSYKEFLKAFSVLQEESKIDPDEFDLSYYTYGLRIYKNMPLIEPLESKEVRKINEFAIVLDTSYSTSGTLIENFLKETYSILSETDSFFRKSRIHIIQCDEMVRMDEVVTSKEEMEALLNKFTVVGGQGTDFRPAFQYINEQIETGNIKELSGLLYFTDGKGTYPFKRPKYKTAFLFLDAYDESIVPAWAIRYRLDQTEFLG